MDFEQTAEQRQEIREQFPDVYFPQPILEPVWYGRRPTHQIPATKAVVDQNNGHVLSVVSNQYKIVRYEDVLIMVNNIINGIDGYGAIQLAPYSLQKGRRFQIQLKFPEMQKSVKKLDNIVPKLDVFTSLDLSSRLTGRFGAFRLICTNGMGVWELFKRYARKHLQSLDLNDLQGTIQEGLKGFEQQVAEWKNWSNTVIPLEYYNDVWQHLPFSDHEKEKIEVLPEVSSRLTLKTALEQKALTVWDMNSILAQWSTHNIKSEIRRINIEPEIARLMESTYNRIIRG